MTADIPAAKTPGLAAVLFDPLEPVDQVIRAALQDFTGHRLLGWLQGHEIDRSCDCAEIILTAVQGEGRRRITQDLGAQSQGCRLDTAALAEVAGWLAADLARALADGAADPGQAPALMVLNRFGKIEAEGGGLRAVLEQALAADLPVLVPVNRKQLVFWRDYAGELAQELPCDQGAIAAWLGQNVLPACGQHRAAIGA